MAPKSHPLLSHRFFAGRLRVVIRTSALPPPLTFFSNFFFRSTQHSEKYAVGPQIEYLTAPVAWATLGLGVLCQITFRISTGWVGAGFGEPYLSASRARGASFFRAAYGAQYFLFEGREKFTPPPARFSVSLRAPRNDCQESEVVVLPSGGPISAAPPPPLQNDLPPLTTPTTVSLSGVDSPVTALLHRASFHPYYSPKCRSAQLDPMARGG